MVMGSKAVFLGGDTPAGKIAQKELEVHRDPVSRSASDTTAGSSRSTSFADPEAEAMVLQDGAGIHDAPPFGSNLQPAPR